MRDKASSQFAKLIATLQQELELTSTEIADILWLAQQTRQTTSETTDDTATERNKPEIQKIKQPIENITPNTQPSPIAPTQQSPKAEIYTKSSRSTLSSTSGDTLNIKVPDAPGLRQPLKLARALRPLMQKIDSGTEVILNEEATANRIAEEHIRIPVFQPALETAFDLILVIDASNTMIFWRKALQELQQLLEIQGAFRDVQIWRLVTNKEGEIYLQRGTGKTSSKHYQPHSLIDPSGKRLFLLASDCVAEIWHNGKAFSILKIWAQKNIVAIIQMLPQWLWQRTGLSLGAKVQFSSLTPRIANQGLLIKKILLWDDIDFATGTKIPIFTLEENSAKTWSKMIAGKSDAHVTGCVFPSDFIPFTEISPTLQTPKTEEIISNFRRSASPIARKLASLLSAAPVITLPVVRIIQAKMLAESQQFHVAEVFLGGILKPKEEIIFLLNHAEAQSSQSLNNSNTTRFEMTSETNPDDIEFDFINEEIRDNFLQAAPVTDSLAIIDAISQYFAQKINKTLIEFNALLKKPQQTNNENIDIKPFALLTAKVLKRLGGSYIQFVEEMERDWNNLDTKTIKVDLQTFTFEVATVEVQQPSIIIHRRSQTAQFFTETLPNDVILEMVAIPGGKFIMGAPESEEGSTDDERPQHEVTVPPFYMGKYPITQAQWRAVASLDQVNRELNPDPSRFKGENLPVENISWYDAVEFCDRISKNTGKIYRLPSEAEWEYACRAGTTTPFHFGQTITPDLANYNGNYTYGSGSKGEYREQTSLVGSFQVANEFGLFDMHGNVWEWCADAWHENYLHAPSDTEANSDNDNQGTDRVKLLRGGSWYSIPDNCRSASRVRSIPVSNFNRSFGFRVVVDALASPL